MSQKTIKFNPVSTANKFSKINFTLGLHLLFKLRVYGGQNGALNARLHQTGEHLHLIGANFEPESLTNLRVLHLNTQKINHN